jgi:sugar diacid utilization regulator/putative methionine-R-sulfoxide reductase with GAF domain
MRSYRARQFKSLMERLWEQPLLSDECVQAAVDLLARMFGTDVAAIQAYDARAGELLLVATRGLARSGVGHVTIKLGQSITGLAAKERRPVYTADVRTDPAYESVATLDQDRYLSLLAVPVLLDDRLVGTVSLQTAESHQFGAREIQELSDVAAVIGPYLDELWRRDLAARLRGPSALARLEGFLETRPEPYEVARQAAEQLQIVFPARRSSVAMRQPEGGITYFGDVPDQDAKAELARAVASRNNFQHPTVDERHGISVPICAGAQSVGAIYLGLGEGSTQPLSSAANQVLESIAVLVATALLRSQEGHAAEATSKEKAYRELVQMVLDDAGIEALLERSSRFCHGPIAVTDALGGLIAGHVPETIGANLPLKTGDVVIGRLLAATAMETTPELVAAVQALAMELSKWSLRFTVERDLRGDALQSLLSGPLDATDAAMRAHLLGIYPNQTYVTVLFKFDVAEFTRDRGSIAWRSLSSSIERGIGAPPTSVNFVRQDGILVFAQKSALRLPLRKAAGEVLAGMRRAMPGIAVSAGIGTEALGEEQYAGSIRQATLAAELGLQISSQTPVDACQVGPYRLLVGVQDGARLREFVDQYLGLLVEHDSRRGTEFVRTLEAYHASGEKLRQAAAMLFIHVNTLKHRLERIRELTGRDWEQVSQRFNMYLALYAMRLLNPDRRSLLPSISEAEAKG